MGATLGHLLVLNYNVTKMEVIGASASIDFAVTSPEVKAANLFPMSKILDATGWNANDQIINIIAIPAVMQPTGNVVDCSKEGITANPQYEVHVTYTHNDIENGTQIEKIRCINVETNECKSYMASDFKDVGGDEPSNDNDELPKTPNL